MIAQKEQSLRRSRVHKKNVQIDTSQLSIDLNDEIIPRSVCSELKVFEHTWHSGTTTLQGTGFEQECLNRYGKKTCILIQCDEDKYELHDLDNTMRTFLSVSKNLFFELIPQLVSKKYTVVIIDDIPGTGHDITAVHSNEVKMFNPILLI
ncbi:hypothetical protein EBU95_02085 [bacterium]|nr:hypothetical protein [bacterium]